MSQRSSLIEVISENVRHLMKSSSQAAFDKLDSVMELTLFISNHNYETSERLGNAIIALAPVLDRKDLINTAHAAVFYRHRDRVGHEAADKLADDALRACGVNVDKWNAKLNEVPSLAVAS